MSEAKNPRPGSDEFAEAVRAEVEKALAARQQQQPAPGAAQQTVPVASVPVFGLGPAPSPQVGVGGPGTDLRELPQRDPRYPLGRF